MMTPRSVMVGSSPGRAEKLPAPPGLAWLLLRRSRGRSAAARASPMFAARSRSVGATGRSHPPAENEGEEPSSPKVTCIGQVRIKKNKNNIKKKKKKKQKKPVIECRCIQRVICCGAIFERKKGKGSHSRRLWPRWSLGIYNSNKHSNYSKTSYKENRNEANRAGAPASAIILETRMNRSELHESDQEFEPARFSNFGRRSSVSELARDESDTEEKERGGEEEEEEREVNTKVFVSSATTTPPKNALLLMRCRSAPHHHNRFAPSPISTVETYGNEVRQEERGKDPVIVVMEKREESEGSGAEEAEAEEEEEEEDEEEEEEEEEIRCSSARPLVLTRCKSEPARKAAEMAAAAAAASAEMEEPVAAYCFWGHGGSGSRQRRLGRGHEQQQRSPSPVPIH